MLSPSPRCTLFPYTTLFRSARFADSLEPLVAKGARAASMHPVQTFRRGDGRERFLDIFISLEGDPVLVSRSEEHTSELQSRGHLVCRLLLEKKKQLKDYRFT